MIADIRNFQKRSVWICCYFERTIIVGDSSGDKGRIGRERDDVGKGNGLVLRVDELARNTLSVCYDGKQHAENYKNDFHKAIIFIGFVILFFSIRKYTNIMPHL